MRIRFLPAILLASLATAANAQSSAFTYQGRLKNGAAPASGLHDFRFRLWDAATGGTQIGAAQCVDNITVTEGLFATTLDFGSQFATPAPRFIEIEVRSDTGLDCSNPTGFVVLIPRQLISPTPLASHATSAFSLDAANGSVANAVFVDNAGKVGIGTLSPTHSVHIATPAPTIALQDTDSTTQQVGYVSYRDSGNVERAWVGYGSAGDPDFSIVNARSGGDIVLNTFGGGNVGIGTTAPASKLDVRGDIRLGPTGQYQASAGEERLRTIRGVVASNATILAGAGFTVTHPTTGLYHITFTSAFAGTPAVGSMGQAFTSGGAVLYSNLSADSVDFYPQAGTDGGFSFIAVGPR